MIETKFKETEVGRVPVDWEVKKLGEIAEFSTESIITDAIDKDWYIGTENMLSDKAGVTKNTSNIPYQRVKGYKENDVLISNIRPYLKKIWLSDRNGGCSSDVLVVRVNRAECKPSFMKQQLSADSFFDYAMANAIGTKMPRGDKKALINYQIPLPSLPEQRRIVSALSSVDSLISNLDTLIEKKRNIKQGAMQQLLTGKTRLDGFSEPWVEKKLGEVAEMNSGGTPSSKEAKYYGGNIPFLSIGDMSMSGKFIKQTEKTITQAGLDNSSARVFPAGTLMYAIYASLGKCSISTITTAISQAILGFKLSNKIDRDFLYYHLCYIEESVKTMGQTGTQANLSKGIVEDFTILLPSLSEQRAIASILTSMDEEIAKLEQKREKYAAVKQGMMQQLLTGKIRLTD